MRDELKAKIEAGLKRRVEYRKRWALAANELKEAYAADWRNFRGADLSGANLRGANLSGANLSSADLSSADLSYADLSSANLSSADLSSADLSYANLRGANLSYADLSSADLSSADLSSANLSGANLSDANLYGANLSGANLSGANLSGADLSSADLNGAKISDDKKITGYFTRNRIGSDNAELQVAYNKTDIWLRRGCSGWLTPVEFLERVKERHGDNLHAQIYRLTVAHIVEVVALERKLKP